MDSEGKVTITFSIQSIIIRFIMLSIEYINKHKPISNISAINTVITLYILNLINADIFCKYLCNCIIELSKINFLENPQSIFRRVHKNIVLSPNVGASTFINLHRHVDTVAKQATEALTVADEVYESAKEVLETFKKEIEDLSSI